MGEAEMARRRTELVKADAGTDLLVPEAAGAGAPEIHRGTETVGSPAGPPAERPEDVLAQPPDTRDISAELAAPPRRPLPWLTLVLSACVVAAGAFSGGALVEKNHLHGGSGSRAGTFTATAGRTGRSAGTGSGFGAGTGSGATAGAGRGQSGGGAGGRTGSGAGTSGSGVTFGTVTLVDGSTIYVTDPRGDIVKVTTGGSTKVTESKDGKVADLKPGQSVTVRGTSTADGGIAATTVTQGQATGGGFGGGGFPGFGGSGGSGG
jgi:hypothetical protein